MWLVAASRGKGKTTALLQVAANLVEEPGREEGREYEGDGEDGQDARDCDSSGRVMFIGAKGKLENEAPDHLIEAWEQHKRGEAPEGTGKKGILSRVDMRYVSNEEELKQTLACLHLVRRKPKALLVDDLDTILSNTSKADGFGKFEARLAKVSAYLKNVAHFLQREECEACPVIAAISKPDDSDMRLPYLSTLKKWFSRIVEITDTSVDNLGDASRSVFCDECKIIQSSIEASPFEDFVLEGGAHQGRNRREFVRLSR